MFALGCILYELCMHVPPFHFEDMAELKVVLKTPHNGKKGDWMVDGWEAVKDAVAEPVAAIADGPEVAASAAAGVAAATGPRRARATLEARLPGMP